MIVPTLTPESIALDQAIHAFRQAIGRPTVSADKPAHAVCWMRTGCWHMDSLVLSVALDSPLVLAANIGKQPITISRRKARMLWRTSHHITEDAPASTIMRAELFFSRRQLGKVMTWLAGWVRDHEGRNACIEIATKAASSAMEEHTRSDRGREAGQTK